MNHGEGTDTFVDGIGSNRGFCYDVAEAVLDLLEGSGSAAVQAIVDQIECSLVLHWSSKLNP